MNSDSNQNSAQEPEAGSCLEERGNTSNSQGNDKPVLCISCDLEKLSEKQFVNDTIKIFDVEGEHDLSATLNQPCEERINLDSDSDFMLHLFFNFYFYFNYYFNFNCNFDSNSENDYENDYDYDSDSENDYDYDSDSENDYDYDFDSDSENDSDSDSDSDFDSDSDSDRRPRQIQYSDINIIAGAPIRIAGLNHYAALIYFLIDTWYKNPDSQDIYFLVGKFTVQMRQDDLYCCPIKEGDKEIHVNNRDLSYTTMQTSPDFKKKCSETLWNYIKGNHGKVDLSIQVSGDATALCAVLFSEVIRYPKVFYLNILMMETFKSWQEFKDNHPMLTGGSCKNLNQNNSVPVKVREREEKLLHTCALKMIDRGKRSVKFYVY
ncbi:uncharacterized protein LOC143714457 [Siphateles boraxobius]|uniref:uncharacterized protein LOC143714457 n=1 Tax=Siphateles boraxobius TaxID=180520 RepID=UPI0040645E95